MDMASKLFTFTFTFTTHCCNHEMKSLSAVGGTGPLLDNAMELTAKVILRYTENAAEAWHRHER